MALVNEQHSGPLGGGSRAAVVSEPVLERSSAASIRRARRLPMFFRADSRSVSKRATKRAASGRLLLLTRSENP
jgi:hypothetical protein